MSRQGGQSNDRVLQQRERREVAPVFGSVVKDSFLVMGALKSQGGFTVYQISFKISTQDSEKHDVIQEFEILKRFSDFQNLSKQLEAIHLHTMPKIKFPSLVKAKYFERFKDSVIEERKRSIQETLLFVARHPHLADSTPLRLFIAGAKLQRTMKADGANFETKPERVDPDALIEKTKTNVSLLASQPKTNNVPSVSGSGSESNDPLPDSVGKPEEELSAGSSVISTTQERPNTGDLVPVLDTKPDIDTLVPNSERTPHSGASSSVGSKENLLTGSNVSLENMELDATLIEKDAVKLGDSEDTSNSSSDSASFVGSKEEPYPEPAKTDGGASGGIKNQDMSWWTEAMAETDIITDDLDQVIDKMEKVEEQGINSKKEKGSHQNSQSSSSRQPASNSRQGYKHSPSSSHQSSAHSSRSPSPRRLPPNNKAAYIVQAGRLISQALSYEKEEEYDEAFDLLKAGVDVLLNGVQTDDNKERRETVRRKTSEYLIYAENLQKKIVGAKGPAVNQTLGKTEDTPAPSSSKPHHLPDFRVRAILQKVMLVESKHTGDTYVFKVLHKSLKAMAALPKGQSKQSRNRSPHQCPHMVKLLHHYETPNHRIFLLLEHIKRGMLIDFVTTKREQWRQLRNSAANPPPSSSLLCNTEEANLLKELEEEASKEEVEEKEEEAEANEDDNEEDLEMEKMLSELTTIIPPNVNPLNMSLSSLSDDSDFEDEEKDVENDSLDTLALLKKRLEESMADNSRSGDSEEESKVKDVVSSSQKKPNKPMDELKVEVASDTVINVLPPTPTVKKDLPGVGGDVACVDSLSVRTPGSFVNVEQTLSGLPQTLGGSPSSKSVTASQPVPVESSDQSPFFSPVSLHNSPDLKVDDWGQRLEDSVRQWAAQIVLALEHLHTHNIICRDLHPGNILLSDVGSAVLTYFGQWDFVEEKGNVELTRTLYMAPELQSLEKPTEAADWWSLGAFLFELLTGKTLKSCYPGGIHSHLPLRIPVPLSSEAQSLLAQLLQVSPTERLGSGPAGVEELKAHSFFAEIDWTDL